MRGPLPMAIPAVVVSAGPAIKYRFLEPDVNLDEYIEKRKDLSNARVCKEFYNLCTFDFTISLVWPVCVIVLMGVQICIVSFFVDRANRRAFVYKRLVEVQVSRSYRRPRHCDLCIKAG